MAAVLFVGSISSNYLPFVSAIHLGNDGTYGLAAHAVLLAAALPICNCVHWANKEKHFSSSLFVPLA